MIIKNSNNNWIIKNPLFKNNDRGFYYDFGKGKNFEKDDFLEGFNDPFGEKERKERLEKIRVKPDNQSWSSQGMLSSQTDPFLEGFNGISTEENKMTPDLFKKTTGILSPQLPYDTDRVSNDLQNAFRGSQFDGALKPITQRLNSSSTITPAINRNLNAKNEFEHAIGDPNKEPVVTQYSANTKESFIDKVFSKEVNNNIYTSKGNSYTEKSKGTIGISKSDYYYAEKDGKRYRANSLETVNYYDWNSIDENFLNGKFLDIIDEANKNPTHILRVLTQSVDGDLDFKLKLDENTLYLINGVLYNKNEAGNFVWAYFLESHKYSGLFSGALAQGGTLLSSLSKMNGTARLDEEWDRSARWAGIRYYYEKNNKLPLYYYLYGNKIKY